MTIRTGWFLSLLCFFSISLSSAAQDQPVYEFQKDDKILKKSFYEESLRKKAQLLASANNKNAADYQRIYEDQFNEIGRLWQSDRSVTAPVAHEYLQSVVRKIAAANPEIKNTDARIVFSRDWWPNAYSMGDGTIAVNAGLMIYLDNEAELVFILCHELAHYYLNHTGSAVTRYVETINSDGFQKELKRLSRAEYGVNRQLEELTRSFAFSSRRHTRDNETAADGLAFRFMKNTGYDCGAIQTCLQLLDNIDSASINKAHSVEQVFSFREYPFRKKWVQKESSIFSQLDDRDSPLDKNEKDSLKTHPDCSKRISLLSDSVQATLGKGKKFLVSESSFNRLKKEFFVEMTEQCYREKNLSRNLYYSMLLLEDKENLPVAIFSVARCLNEIYASQKMHLLGSKLDTENKGYPEEYNRLLRMLGRLRLEEIAMINIHFCKQYRDMMKGYAGFDKEMRKAESLSKDL